MSSARHSPAAALRAAAVVALLVSTAARPAEAQLGGLMKKAKQAAAEKTAEKAVDRAAEKAGAGAAGGGAAGGAQPVSEELVRKVLAYDAAQVAEYNRIVSTDPRFRSYGAARAGYDRCYARNVGYERAIRRYSRLADQARLDGKTAAFSKWSDSLNATRMAQLAAVPTGCAIPELGSELADAASEGARKAAAAQTGLNDRQLGTMTERITGYLRLSPAERRTAVSSGAFSADEVAVIEKSQAGLESWMRHGWRIEGGEADPQAVAKYEEERTRYAAARESYERCMYAARQAGGTPEMPGSIQTQMANMKAPTPEQEARIERLGKLGEEAGDRGDMATAKLYADSIQAVLGVKMDARAQADGQKFAREVTAAQEKSEAAQKKCGLAPEEPIKPAYVR
ncbi:MAG: hypothetical protein ACJ79S_11865 [Gemmatimonadaceae bacterium]